MKQLLVLILAVGLSSADIGLTYKVPDTSYGVPAYQYNNNADYNTGYAGASGYNYKAESSAQAGYQQDLGQQTGYQYTTPLAADSNNAGYQTANYQNNIGSQYQTGGLNSGYSTVSQPSYQYTDASSQGGQSGYQYQSSSEYQSSAVQKHQQFYNNWQQAPAQVFKHFYVHAAPEEPEEPKIRQPVALPPPQKHYKIIFIKAPTQTVYQPQYIPVPQPNEEKTIVYVLVKKPEEQKEVVVPKLEQKAPSKPEVFFIKYNNKADSSAVINNIVSDYNKVDSVNFAAPGSANQFGSGQYNQGSSGQYNQGSSGQYNKDSSGQYNQASSGQYNQGSTGQYNQGSSGQYNQDSSSYNKFDQKGSGGQASTGFGTSFGGLSTQSLSAAGTNAATTSTAGYTAASAGNSANSLNAISTSQGIPHETYGPPKFRV